MSSIRYPSGRPYTLDWRCRPGPSNAPAYSNVYSLQFDGVNDYVDFGTSINGTFARANPFSLSAWVHPLALPASAPIFDNLDTASNYRGVFVGTAGATVYLQLIDETGQPTCSAPSAFTVGVWTHLVVTYDGSSNLSTGAKIYLNGVAQTTGATGTAITGNTVSSVSLRLGGQQGVGDGFWNGYIDEPAIYTSVLSQADVTAIYNSGHPNDLSTLASASSLQHWWRDGDAPDTISAIADRVGSATGTPTNMLAGAITAFVP